MTIVSCMLAEPLFYFKKSLQRPWSELFKFILQLYMKLVIDLVDQGKLLRKYMLYLSIKVAFSRALVWICEINSSCSYMRYKEVFILIKLKIYIKYKSKVLQYERKNPFMGIRIIKV